MLDGGDIIVAKNKAYTTDIHPLIARISDQMNVKNK